MAGAGIPDLDGIFKDGCGIEFKLELKVKSTSGNMLASLWRPTQISWQTRRSRLGGKVWNLVHHPSSHTFTLLHGSKLVQVVQDPSSVIPDLTTNDGDYMSIINYIREH